MQVLGSRAGGTDHWSLGAGKGTQSLSCYCLGRDLRLIEVTETICKRLLDYSLHKERTGSNRFAKVGLCLSFLPAGARPACGQGVCWCGCNLPWELPSLASSHSLWIAVYTPPLLGCLTFPWHRVLPQFQIGRDAPGTASMEPKAFVQGEVRI